ncbi:MAG: hypothetical protein ABS913_00075 [Desemzia incerta]|uniref:DUF308 domain-containing protein n=1 Tax=Desemzia incerta TaxID=82801 RepID=A0A1I5YI22_9LACT|nr:hypothetical protein [Desemzia incerta]WHZ31871.1 hypothetical protein QNK01_10415 [Desemzia incerta]SFQ43861.1 hypothetical protein SAMN04488506_2035 [Desemzia incerta]
MNKRLGKWQMIVGSLIIILGAVAMIIQPFVAVFVILYGAYILFVGYRIKSGDHPLNKDKKE